MADDLDVTKDGTDANDDEVESITASLKAQLEAEAQTMGGGGATPAIHARTGVNGD